MSKASEAREQQTRALDALHALFPRDSHVSVYVVKVNSSGMSRDLAVFAVDQGWPGTVRNVSGYVATALGWRATANRDAVKVSGAGMDMRFHLVYTLGQALHGDGYALNVNGLN